MEPEIPDPPRFTEEDLNWISGQVARGITRPATDLTHEQMRRLSGALCNLFTDVVNSPTFKVIMENGMKLGSTILTRNRCSGYELVGRLATELYDSASETWAAMEKFDENSLLILKGLMYSICLLFSILIAIALKVLQTVGEVVLFVAKAAWDTIQTITSFTWKLLLQALNNPMSWGLIAAYGGNLAAGSVLLGAVVIGVGVRGLWYTHNKAIYQV